MPPRRKPPMADPKRIAIAYKSLFDALVESGFTAEQANDIVATGEWNELVKQFEFPALPQKPSPPEPPEPA
jgi:hypothetical protein